MIAIEERTNVAPICPHCDQPLDRVARTRLKDTFGKAYIWVCPHCQKVLGVTQRKGFWMG
ncbi:MAG: hypothetical protein GXP48_07455 [Acidobacteria bacterium]|nr:hypothetical protein [Acidobacteriota bacterium]